MRALVVGGGIVGVSVAWRLAQQGAEVTLLEAGGLGGGTTSASFAWLNAGRMESQAYFRLKVDALSEFRRLGRELGEMRWLHLDGHIEWNSAHNEIVDARGYDGSILDHDEKTGSQRIRDKVEQLRSWGYAAELLPISSLRDLEPDLLPSVGIEEFAYYADEGYLDPVDAVGDFASRVEDYGGIILSDTPVVDFVFEGDRIKGVVTADDAVHTADIVINCVGSWSAGLLRKCGIELPMSPTIGMVALTSPSPARLRSVHHNESLSIRPDGAGRMMIRNHDFDRMVDVDTPLNPIPSFLDDLLERAVRVLPKLSSSRIEAIRIAARSIPGDDYPVVGSVPGTSGLYLVVCHGGATLGPLLGRIVAKEILTGELDRRLVEFRPDRLISMRSRG